MSKGFSTIKGWFVNKLSSQLQRTMREVASFPWLVGCNSGKLCTLHVYLAW